VIPCYNEAARLPGDELASLVDDAAEIDLLLVNDGSTDGTEDKLRELAERRPGRIHLLLLERNGGKAEAVRRGLVEALARGAEIVGYLDADLATPLSEMRRLTEIVMKTNVDIVLGSRVLMLGRRIERRHLRHYLGRVFATGASLALNLPVYDTQCGAKVFRRTARLEEALLQPFLSRWAFDVELLARLVAAPGGVEGDRLVEEPLLEWRDVTGSKLHLGQMVGAFADLGRIAWRIRRRVTAAGSASRR
jgi:glycosyltransferase involved in cell wall biosynthesis